MPVKSHLIPLIQLLSSALLILMLAGCSPKPGENNEQLIECLQREKLTPEAEAQIKKKIHAAEKSYSLDTLFSKKVRVQGFNGSVLVAQKGIILYHKVFGFADMSQKDTLSVNSAFQLASVSKTFTGTAILLLVQDGKLNLLDSIQQFIPSFPYHSITIEQLLSHRSGLPNYLYCFEDKRKQNGPAPTNDTVLKWFGEADPLPAPYTQPGKSFSYNNTNYILLASIIEKVSGISYAEFISTRILQPLGMSHSFIDTIAPDSIRCFRTNGHQGNRIRAREYFDGVYGDKGIYSTASDMGRWYYALHSGCLLNKHWLKEAFTPRSFEHKSRHNYGLGFRLMTDPDNMKKVNYVYHGGWWAGYSTMFWMDMEADIVIIVLGNKKNNSVYDIKSILSILEDDKDTEVQEVKEEGGN